MRRRRLRQKRPKSPAKAKYRTSWTSRPRTKFHKPIVSQGEIIMSGKNTAVFGIYPSYANVESGVDGLKAAGFSNRDISVLFPESAGSKDFAHEKGTKAPEGATAGAGTGLVIGGTMGGLWGIGALG